MTEERLTRAERGDLQKIARMRSRNNKAAIEARKAELLADLESELAAEYPVNDARWAQVTAEAKAAVQAADQIVAARCEELGIRPEFRPGLNIVWYRRGDNASNERRTELRRLGQAKVDAAAKAARLEIDRVELEACTAILTDGLRSVDAQEFLARIPSPDQLMRPVTLDEVEVERLESKAARGRGELAARIAALGDPG